MDKREARNRLIKDGILAVVAWALCGVLFAMLTPMGGYGFIISIICAGIPFGWRWLSKIITAMSFFGIVIKILLSVFIGWIAIFVVLIKDIIMLATAE